MHIQDRRKCSLVVNVHEILAFLNTSWWISLVRIYANLHIQLCNIVPSLLYCQYTLLWSVETFIFAIQKYIFIILYVSFCTIMSISRQKEARSRAYALLLFRMTSRIVYSAQYHRQHFEPGTSRLQAPVDTNERSGPAYGAMVLWTYLFQASLYYKFIISIPL